MSFPIDEATASASYLTDHGIDEKRVLRETWSLDTIGNAVFTRLMHAEPRQWKRMLVVTSAFHMPRTRAVFDWVFKLPPEGPGGPMVLDYEESTDSSMSTEVQEARLAKELSALESLNETMANVTDVAQLHEFIFTRHEAYATAPSNETSDQLEAANMDMSAELNASYGDAASLSVLPPDDLLEGWKLLPSE